MTRFARASRLRSSPRPWRCFQSTSAGFDQFGVFSTSVEVFLVPRFSRLCKLGLLHVRGGVSDTPAFANMQAWSSPRPWRCFLNLSSLNHHAVVFSTSVEVFPFLIAKNFFVFSLLHVRGGVSGTPLTGRPLLVSSPRPWRCFLKQPETCLLQVVFSTSVEVFL